MSESISILAVIPARGGSKGILKKNLRKVGDETLVGRACKFAMGIPQITRTVVSSDDEQIIAEARKYGVSCPEKRPGNLSGDLVGDMPVLAHALKVSEMRYEQRYSYVLMLQPTSPLRKREDVMAVIGILTSGRYDAVWTVTETDSKSHPLKQLIKTKNGLLDYYDSAGSNILARQQLQPVFHRNGVAYGFSSELIRSGTSLLGEKTFAYKIDSPQISIDTEFDIKLADLYIAGAID